jgi:hypothetical protein
MAPVNCDKQEPAKKRVDVATMIGASLLGLAGFIVLIVALAFKIKHMHRVSELTIGGLLLLLAANIFAWILHTFSMKYQMNIHNCSAMAPVSK